MKHDYVFTNHTVRPTAIVSSPGFGSVSMMVGCAALHLKKRTNSAAFVYMDMSPRHVVDFAEDAPIRWGQASKHHLPTMKRELEGWISACVEEGKHTLFIGVDAGSIADRLPFLQMIDELDTRNTGSLSLVYIVNAD